MRQYSLKKDYSQRMPWYVWLVLLGVLLATVVHFTVEPNPVHAQVKTPDLYQKSDKEQEAEYCKEISKGVTVHGANASQVELHCMRY